MKFRLFKSFAFVALTFLLFALQPTPVSAADPIVITPSANSISLPVGGGDKSFTFTIKKHIRS